MEGKNVVIDNTNFNERHLIRYRQVARDFNAELEVKFFDTPWEVCAERDANREDKVGIDVIRKMAMTYLGEPCWNNDLPFAIICDVDGTLAKNVTGRSYYDARGAYQDNPNFPLCVVLSLLLSSPMPINLIFVSGRFETDREVTEKFISEKAFMQSIPENLVGAREVGMVRVLYRNELVGAALALDHLDDVLLVEILETETNGVTETQGEP